MDIKHIQRSIIAGAVGEAQYNRVKFLEPKDFDIEYREIWDLVAWASGDLKKIYKHLLGKRNFDSRKFQVFLMSDYTHIETMALLLLEIRFKSYLIALVGDMSIKTENATEGLILAQTREEIEKEDLDVFDLIYSTPEYLKQFISKANYNRLIDLQKYVERRAKNIKSLYEPNPIHK